MLVKIFSQLMTSVRALLILGVLIFAKSSTFVSSIISLVRFQMFLIMTRRIQYTVSKYKIYLPLATVFVASNRWLLFFFTDPSFFLTLLFLHFLFLACGRCPFFSFSHTLTLSFSVSSFPLVSLSVYI